LQQAAAKLQGSQPQSVNPHCGDGGGWRGGVEEESVAKVVESTGCQDLDLVEHCLLENGYDSDLAIVELLQLMDLSVDHCERHMYSLSDEYPNLSILIPF